MSDSQTPAGWYRDPTGEAGYRWWDGYAWSSSTSPDPAAGRPGPSGMPPSMPPMSSYVTSARPQLPPDRPIYGVLIWLITLLPLLSWPLSLVYQPHFRIITVENGVRTIDPLSIYTPGYFAVSGVSLAIYIVTIVLAFRDQRWLVKQGVVRPFAWGWAFLQPVYIIGRSVIVNGVTPKHALWPVWVLIVIEVVGLAIGLSHSAATFQQIQKLQTP